MTQLTMRTPWTIPYSKPFQTNKWLSPTTGACFKALAACMAEQMLHHHNHDYIVHHIPLMVLLLAWWDIGDPCMWVSYMDFVNLYATICPSLGGMANYSCSRHNLPATYTSWQTIDYVLRTLIDVGLGILVLARAHGYTCTCNVPPTR